MPRFDGTGPNGQGPRTGRGMGSCQGKGNRGRFCPILNENQTGHSAKLESLEKEIEQLKDKIKHFETK